MKTRRKSFMLLLFILMALCLTLSCQKTDDELPGEPVPINLTDNQIALVESSNEFSFDIFRKILADTPPEENIIISPLSISYALSMTVNGANGPTRDSILKVLRINNISLVELNNSYKYLTAALLSVDKRVAMKIANSVWTENKFSSMVKEAFIEILKNYYSAQSKSFDINDSNTPSYINKWIEDNTNGLIKDMIDKLDPATVTLLINAIYFKGTWKYEFDKASTAPRQFTKPDGSVIQVHSMNQSENHKVLQGNGFVMVELPYGQGNFVMDIILPEQADNTFYQTVTGQNFNTWVSSMSKTGVNLYLPKFKYDYKKKLKELLSDMGMGLAFSDFADFTNIANAPLRIDEVTHQALIETNEEGTEAAAATVVTIVLTSIGPGTPLLIDINRPFIYIIREITTNTVIFMGKVADPTSE
ncbi:MAG: serpin family protein [Bacteroidales bacterium]